MSAFDAEVNRVRGLNRFARTALLAECGDRVLPIYEEYWVGDYDPAVGQSVELGWTYAGGSNVDEAELRKCLFHVQDAVEYYYEDVTRIDLLAQTCVVVLRILQSITPDETESCRGFVRGIGSTIEAAKAAEAHANERIPHAARPQKVALVEEKAWQERAMVLIDGWTGPIARGMFDHLGVKPPAWYLDWLARSER